MADPEMFGIRLELVTETLGDNAIFESILMLDKLENCGFVNTCPRCHTPSVNMLFASTVPHANLWERKCYQPGAGC